MMKSHRFAGPGMALLALGLTVVCGPSQHRAGSAGGAGSSPASKDAHPRLTRFQTVQGSWVRIEGSTSMHDWQARSLEVTGFVEVAPGFPNNYGAAASEPDTGERVEVSLPVRSLKSIDLDGKPFSTAFDDMLHDSLKANTFPEVVYRLTELVRAHSAGAGPPYAFDSTGRLCIAGITNRVSMPVQVQPLEGGKLKIIGSTKVKMTAFNIKPRLPPIVDPGPLKYSDDVRISVEWLLQKSEVRPAREVKTHN
jgi:YceI-like domain